MTIFPASKPRDYCSLFWFSIVECVNGVICLVNDCQWEGTGIILWNPSIRKYVRAPRPLYNYDTYGPYESVCGFGFDSISDDYKVVRVVRIDANLERSEIEVYSLRTRCWKAVGAFPNYLNLKRLKGYIPCFLRGSVHWVGVQRVHSKSKMVIFKFDLSLESYEIMGVPDKSEGSFSTMDWYVQECFGRLILIRRDIYSAVWLMEEYGIVESWTMVNCFGIAHSYPYGEPRAFGFRKKWHVIVVRGERLYERETVNNEIVSLDLEMNTEKFLREVTANGCSFYMSTYVESMVLFKEGKGSDDLTMEIEDMNDQLEEINIGANAEEEEKNEE